MKFIIESQYCPPIETFHFLKTYGSVCWDVHSNYTKGTYRNRCHIVSSHGELRLSIPLKKGKHQRLPLHLVEISYDEDWQKQHWQSILSSYNRSAYFEYYKDDLEELFFLRKEFLIDFNQELFYWLVQELKLTIEQEHTTQYVGETPDNMKDLRNQILPNTYWQDQKPYAQVFSDRQPFHNNMSILDLLFSQGPNAQNYF